MNDYKKEYETLLIDMWNMMGAISDDQQHLHHMGSKSDHLALVTRSVLHEMLGSVIFTNKRETWQRTIEKYEQLDRSRYDND